MKSIYLFVACIIILFASSCGKKDEPVEPVEPPQPPIPPKELTFASLNPAAKRLQGISFVINGKLYVAMGKNSDGKMTGTVQVYDPNINIWQMLDDVPNVIGGERIGATAFTIGDRAYVFGGYDGNSPIGKFCSYDQIHDKWNAEPAPLTPRAWPVSFVIDSTAYVLGGYDGKNALAELWSFKPGAGWNQLNDFSGGPRGGATSFVIDRTAYIVAGFGLNIATLKKDLWKYDPDNDTWLKMSNLPSNKRYGAVSFAIGENGESKKGYVFTGYGSGFEYLDDGWEYDPETDIWEEVNMPDAFLPRFGALGAALNDTEAIIVGGQAFGNGQLGDTWKWFFQ